MGENSYRFDCEVRGLPAPRVEWYKDSQKLDKDNLTQNVQLDNDDMRCVLLPVQCKHVLLLKSMLRGTGSSYYIVVLVNSANKTHDCYFQT